MAEVPMFLLIHRVGVLTLTGAGAYGPTFAPEVILPCRVTYKRRLVRGELGEQVLSEATLTFLLRDSEKLTPGSLLILSAGARPDKILTSVAHDDGGMGAWQNTEVTV